VGSGEGGTSGMVTDDSETFKADSHIACRAHAALMPFPCHAVP